MGPPRRRLSTRLVYARHVCTTRRTAQRISVRAKSGAKNLRPCPAVIVVADPLQAALSQTPHGAATARLARIATPAMPPPSLAPAPTPSALSSLSTQTLSRTLELTRLHQLDLATPAHLSSTIQGNLGKLARGINALEREGQTSHDVLVGLRGQWERIAALVGVHIEERLRSEEEQGRTGRLVETDDEREAGDEDDDRDG